MAPGGPPAPGANSEQASTRGGVQAAAGARAATRRLVHGQRGARGELPAQHARRGGAGRGGGRRRRARACLPALALQGRPGARASARPRRPARCAGRAPRCGAAPSLHSCALRACLALRQAACGVRARGAAAGPAPLPDLRGGHRLRVLPPPRLCTRRAPRTGRDPPGARRPRPARRTGAACCKRSRCPGRAPIRRASWTPPCALPTSAAGARCRARLWCARRARPVALARSAQTREAVGIRVRGAGLGRARRVAGPR